jgi:hypothetical protein
VTRLLGVIARPGADEDAQPAADLATDLAVDGHRGVADPLDDSAHAGSR